MPVKNRALYTCSSRFSSEIHLGSGLILIIFLLTLSCIKCIFFQFNNSITKKVTAICLNFLTLNKFRICIRNRKLFKTFKLLYFQLAIISRLTSLLKDFQVGILLQSYYRINSIKISKIKVKKWLG